MGKVIKPVSEYKLLFPVIFPYFCTFPNRIINSVKHSIFLILFLFLCVISPLGAQHIGYKQYTVADGLVQSEVTRIHQDQKGFIWVGTKMGLSRFDGIAFETIRDSANVLRSVVWSIEKLNDSALVVLTSRGYAIITYGKAGMRMKSGFLTDPYHSYWIRNGKAEILTMHQKELALIAIDHTGAHDQKLPFPGLSAEEFLARTGCRVHYAAKHDVFYFVDFDGLFAAVKNNRRIGIISEGSAFGSGMDGDFYLQSVSAHQKKGKTEITISRVSDTVVTPLYRSGPVFANAELTSFVISPDHFYISDPFDQSLIRVFHGIEKRFKTDHITGWRQMYDMEGNLWLGGPHGLTRTFGFHIIHFSEEDGYLPNSQSVLTDANDDLVIASFDRGLQVLKNGMFRPVPVRNFFDPAARVNLYPGSRRDSRGMAHIMGPPYSVIRWDGEKILYPDKYPHGGGFSFFEDTAKRLFYYGTDHGLVLQPYHGEYTILPIYPGKKKNKIVAIEKDRKGRLILGGFQGTSIYSENQTIHLPTPDISYDLGANAMARDQKGNIWIGNNDGLWLFDGDNFRKVRCSRFNDFIASLFMVDSSYLFIGGLRAFGLLDVRKYYAEDTVLIHYYDRESGFTGEECQQNAVTIDKAGNLWFLGINNLFRISPHSAIRHAMSLPVYITRVSVATKSQEEKHRPVLTMPATIPEFGPGENNIRFDFTGLFFQAPDQVHFRYRLDGYSGDWSTPTPERYATFTNLPPGTYTFSVIAASDAGGWSENKASITFIIRPAFWQTWWFRTLVPLLFAIAFFWLGFIFMNKKRREEKEKLETEKRMAELQLISIRNQIDPHFTFNAINSIASVILKEEKEKAYSFFVKLSALIRQVLTSGDKITRPMAEELGFVRNYLEIEKLRFRDSFNFSVEIGEGVDLDREVPKMVIQTYAENALKHGLLNKKDGNGDLKISVTEESGNLHIVVEDNGIGRQAAKALGLKSTGKGMQILNSYYDFFNRYNHHKIQHEIIDIFDDQNHPAGTRVVVIIPSGFHYQSKIHETR